PQVGGGGRSPPRGSRSVAVKLNTDRAPRGEFALDTLVVSLARVLVPTALGFGPLSSDRSSKLSGSLRADDGELVPGGNCSPQLRQRQVLGRRHEPVVVGGGGQLAPAGCGHGVAA